MSNKVIDAIKKLLPEENLTEVSSAIDGMLAEVKTELEAEFNQKLEEAYSDLSAELANAEKIAEAGYEEAYNIIVDLRNRIEMLKEEYDKQLEEGYEEAYQMILAERGKNSTLELEMQDEVDKKFEDMREFFVDKLDEFLHVKGAEIYEQAKRDVLNDPRMAERNVAMDRVVDAVHNFLSDEDQTYATSNKLEHAHKKIEELEGQMKLMEARHIRLSRENTKLNEQVRHSHELLTEARADDRKERAKKAKNVSGRGKLVEEDQIEVIKEHQETPKKSAKDTNDAVLVESLGYNPEELKKLAGTVKSN